MTAIVTAEQLVGGLAARIENGVDANYEGDNKRLKDAMVAQNFFTGGSGGVAGVSSVNGATGAVTLKTVNGQALTGTGDIVVSGGGAAGVSSFNGRTGVVSLSAEDVTGALTTPLPINKGGTGATTATGAINALLPSQAGNEGKVLSTNGSNIQWVTATGGAAGVSSVNGATGAVTLKTVNGQALTGSGSITGLTAGSTSAGFINYNGTSATAGQWYGGTSMPTGTTRLNFAGSLVSNLPTANGFIRVVDSTYPSVLLMGSYHEDPLRTSPDNGLFNYSVVHKMANIGGYGPGTSVALIAGVGMSGFNIIAKGTDSQLDIRVPTLIGYTSSQSSEYKLQVNSQIFATSSTIATSDKRYKTNVTELTGALDLVNKLSPVQFDWLKHPVHVFPEGKTVGFIAQEVAEVLKDTDYANSVVKANNCELPDGTTEEFLGIAEGNLIALLTAAVKELTSQVQALTAKVLQLESAAQ